MSINKKIIKNDNMIIKPYNHMIGDGLIKKYDIPKSES